MPSSARLLPAGLWLVLTMLVIGPVFAKGCPDARGYTSHGSESFSSGAPVGGHSIERDGMHIDVVPNSSNLWISNATFGNAWICVSFQFPKEVAAQGELGLVFWFVNSNDFSVIVASPDGFLRVYRNLNGNWTEIQSAKTGDMVASVPDPHSDYMGNSLQAVATGNRLQVILNDFRIMTVEMTPPEGRWSAGIFAQARGNERYSAHFPSVELIELK
jgi:hypothetical protein